MSYKRENNFLDNWGYISDVLQSIPDAVFYKVVKTDEQYKSGKQVYKCYFLNEKMDKIITERRSMLMVSKTTNKEYYMCEFQEHRKPKFTPELQQQIDFAFERIQKK